MRKTALSDLKTTPLYAEHLALGGKIVDFGGWALPVNYGSQIEEHHAVRTKAGMFDVSHMNVTDIIGKDARAFLRYLLANDIGKTDTTSGKAIYSCLLNEQGGVIDDLIAYHITPDHYRIVSNAGTRETVGDWFQSQGGAFDVIIEARPELALLALQGPESHSLLDAVLSETEAALAHSLKRFQGGFADDCFIGRTGYTGEDGFEFIANAERIVQLWQALSEQGVQACGLGARDTLRLEAGMALYGNDLDIDHTPLESGLKWTVSLNDDRSFIGKEALLTNEPRFEVIGLILLDKGVLRAHQEVELDGEPIGEITSGTFSPTLSKSIAMARIQRGVSVEQYPDLRVRLRNKALAVEVVSRPFVK